ncbi:1,2-phenylacetyl-CoA epoxidase subunit PaaD [Sediminibacterium sp.]|jgi:ring-1,2-phenylacetyl-CoA epoxidase subunit PaaD|uniref:1,2-phenylacetyl-CoA epoxidase subunit PaaD n=1 Tax=Sediminibacterium sp. TaxID=1917865 RepID=UPI0025EB62D6|nr:1,2-phenylacetyl-CoA epoxidase subunit PaaD [Sediminibacterium sp.]MBW0178948.1 phenylacetate-CoA oxygenase subunit PaaJ [Sediminibacterium sp.]
MTVLSNHTTETEKKIWLLLETVTDPEVPVLSVLDLGIIRNVSVEPSGENNVKPVITITPTYSGCPAMDVISINIRMVLLQAGFKDIEIKQVLSPAWTTEWMSTEGKNKLKAYGIAPPQYKQAVCTPDAFQEEEAIQCPQCNSWHTTLISQFGSTACKALYRCEDCKEPFDYFKCH